jgi:hypothetical protein
VAAIDPWDGHLEALTSRLVYLTGGSGRGSVVLLAAPACRMELSGNPRAVSVQLAGPPTPSLDDYRLALLYGLGLHPVGDEGRPAAFAKTLTLHEGFAWDEQTLREIVLEGLAALRIILGAEDPLAATIEEKAAPPRPLPLPRRRKKR